MATSVVGVIKMGNILPRVDFKPTSLAFWASMPPLHHVGSLMSPLYRRPPVYADSCLRSQRRLLHTHIAFPFPVDTHICNSAI